MSKYTPLASHLKTLKSSHYPMSFKDIEAILNHRLPPSAYQYRAWWSNNASNSAMTQAWLDAGWISSDVDLEGQRLVFRRKPGSVAARQAKPHPETPGSENLVLEGLTAETMDQLAARARLEGRNIAETARHILETHSRLTQSERLSLADRLRATSPHLHHVDVTAMIRADRDSR